jgi:hypothetical protein
MKGLRLLTVLVGALAFVLPARPVLADPAGFSSDLDIAVRVAERYWGNKIVGFRPISRIIPYRVDGEVYCGSQPIPTQNAAYCPIGDLQADCFAGAYIGDSVRVGDFSIESGDLGELRNGLFSVGDPPDEPWFQEGAHGSPAQRTASFFDGYEQSLDACDMPASYHG